jgi:cytochrome c553
MWLAAAAALGSCFSLFAHAAGDSGLGEKKFYTCFGCHGVENYRNATMHAQTASLTDQDMEDIAAYLQGPEPVKPSTLVSGTVPTQVATCAACHGENGLGVDAPLVPKPPLLAGQHVDYLEQAIAAYRNGRRKNAVMNGMAQTLASDADVKVVAEYFSRQYSPLVTAKTGGK